MRLLLIGDIVGKPGRQIVTDKLKSIREDHGIDFVVANAENAAGGSGLTPVIYNELIQAGVDCITLGDHAYRRRDIFNILQNRNDIVRPANYPEKAPGKPMAILSASGIRVGVFCLVGRTFMPPVDCPIHSADRIIQQIKDTGVKIIVLDYHAEATSDKQVMGRHLDGSVSAVLGTHTHVATADEQILPFGTAFQCDVGMTGPHLSIIGRRIDRVLETAKSFTPTHFEVASGDVRLCGTMVDIDPKTGLATTIERLEVRANEE